MSCAAPIEFRLVTETIDARVDPNSERACGGVGDVKTQVRRGVPQDSEDVARLLTQIGHPTTAANLRARLVRFDAGGPAVLLVGTRGRCVLGVAAVHVLSTIHRQRDVAWLTLLTVEESARGTGVGRALVDAIIEIARDLDCERLVVAPREPQTDAHAFLEAMGFERTGTRFGKELR